MAGLGNNLSRQKAGWFCLTSWLYKLAASWSKIFRYLRRTAPEVKWLQRSPSYLQPRPSPWATNKAWQKMNPGYSGKDITTSYSDRSSLPVFSHKAGLVGTPFINISKCSVSLFYAYLREGGMRWRKWLRYCATGRKVAVSIANRELGFFKDLIFLWPWGRWGYLLCTTCDIWLENWVGLNKNSKAANVSLGSHFVRA